MIFSDLCLILVVFVEMYRSDFVLNGFFKALGRCFVDFVAKIDKSSVIVIIYMINNVVKSGSYPIKLVFSEFF